MKFDLKRSEIWAIPALCLVLTLLILFRTELFSPANPAWNNPVDHWKYEYVAQHPLGSFHIQPTCWRIGVPLLTRLLPLSTYRSFEILGLLFFVLSGIVLYRWIRNIPRPPIDALLAVLIFYSSGCVVKLVLGGVEGPDAASYFFTILALYAIYRGNDFLAAAALFLGIFAKETLLLVIPLHYTLKAASWIDLPRFKRTVLVGLPAVCAFAAIRWAIPAWNDRPDYVASLPLIYTQVSAFGGAKYDLASAFHAVMKEYSAETPINLLRLFTWGSLGIYLFLPLFAFRKNCEVLLRWAPFWAPTLATLLIAVNPDRRVASLFPVLIVAGLNGIHALSRRLGVSPADFVPILLLQFCLILLQKSVNQPPFDLAAAVFIVSLAVCLARCTPGNDSLGRTS